MLVLEMSQCCFVNQSHSTYSNLCQVCFMHSVHLSFVFHQCFRTARVTCERGQIILASSIIMFRVKSFRVCVTSFINYCCVQHIKVKQDVAQILAQLSTELSNSFAPSPFKLRTMLAILLFFLKIKIDSIWPTNIWLGAR